MDMQMLHLNGYAAASRLRQEGFRLPIVALTAHAMTEDHAKCITAGCTDYLSKPVNRAELLATVHRYLTRNGNAAAAGGPAPSRPTWTSGDPGVHAGVPRTSCGAGRGAAETARRS